MNALSQSDELSSEAKHLEALHLEALRLEALRGLGLLDTEPSEAFDRVTRLAAHALRAPIVLVSLVDESRQWFKSRFGLDAPQTPRSVSFCSHAVAERRPLIVPDAAIDPRFRDNPLVTGEPRIRSYAGIPLYTLTGQAIGTLCAIDRESREFKDDELNILRDFALVIEDIVHALESPRRATGAMDVERLQFELLRANDRLRSIADGVPMTVSYWNRDLRCEFANDACCQWFGVPAEELIGASLPELIGEARFRDVKTFAQRVLEGMPQRFDIVIPKEDGSLVYMDVRYVPDVSASGVVRGFTSTGSDVSTWRNAQLALEAANARLANDSTADHLTGLANRRTLDERCESALTALRDGGERFGLIMLNLTDFGRVNERHGHAVGDDVLRMVGRLLKRQLRSHSDTAARLGGADFAILVFGEYDLELMLQMAQGIRTALRLETVVCKSGIVRVEASFGIAISNATDADHLEILARAEGALYDAKKASHESAHFSGPNAAVG